MRVNKTIIVSDESEMRRSSALLRVNSGDKTDHFKHLLKQLLGYGHLSG